jgi:hypothetical protein
VRLSGKETAFGRFLELHTGGIPVASCGDGFNVGGRDPLVGWDEGGFVDGAVGTRDFFRGVDMGMKGAKGDFAAELREVGSGVHVRW